MCSRTVTDIQMHCRKPQALQSLGEIKRREMSLGEIKRREMSWTLEKKLAQERPRAGRQLDFCFSCFPMVELLT